MSSIIRSDAAAKKRLFSDLDFTVTVEPSVDMLGCKTLWSHCPDKLYHSFLVMGGVDNKRIGAIIKCKGTYVQ